MENSILISHQDYKILDSHTPVLTRKENGQFEFMDCYFMEFIVNANDETMKKIKIVCEPFNYKPAVQNAISGCVSKNTYIRLFLLAGPETIKNKFKDTDDFLALALCHDYRQNTTIQYFEVNYKFRHSYEPNQKYRRVGTSAVNALKQIYQTRELCGESALDALKFWLKNGFTRTNEHELHLYWRHR